MTFKGVLQAAVVLATLPAQGQQAASHPAGAQAPVPPTRYESAFATYQSFRETEVSAWRDLNDEVARAGGHVGIFRGAGHGGHDGNKPATPQSADGQAPVRGAPKAPDAMHQHK